MAQSERVILAVITYFLDLEVSGDLAGVYDSHLPGLGLANEESVKVNRWQVQCDEGVLSDGRNFKRTVKFLSSLHIGKLNDNQCYHDLGLLRLECDCNFLALLCLEHA